MKKELTEILVLHSMQSASEAGNKGADRKRGNKWFSYLQPLRTPNLLPPELQDETIQH